MGYAGRPLCKVLVFDRKYMMQCILAIPLSKIMNLLIALSCRTLIDARRT